MWLRIKPRICDNACMHTPLSRISFVLVEPSHPGNIGATARAMKTMGLSRLALVRPPTFLCAEATAMAAGADDLLVRARVHGSLAEAVAGCGCVVGTTARPRRIPWPVHMPREIARDLVASAADVEVAVLFGREHAGLTNEEMETCQAMIRIPTEKEFGSLNLAAAVQIVAYELRLAAAGTMEQVSLPITPTASPTQAEMQRFYAHLERTLTAVGFLDPEKPRLLMRRLRRLFNRAVLDQTEVNILRGFFTAVEKYAPPAGKTAKTDS
ncbi:MAG TPA: RNA methyltransferase [Gammaproteobacteria bacterium]|nr:RNA methyltransferase [Gammaproteobacteria bacterium]